MNKKKWQAIERARDLFSLDDQATTDEMKQAYRRMCKKYHPDKAQEGDKKKYAEIMHRLTEAYELLMHYTKEYSFPLRPDKDTIYDPEDWWMHRFGQDPLWGKKKR